MGAQPERVIRRARSGEVRYVTPVERPDSMYQSPHETGHSKRSKTRFEFLSNAATNAMRFLSLTSVFLPLLSCCSCTEVAEVLTVWPMASSGATGGGGAGVGASGGTGAEPTAGAGGEPSNPDPDPALGFSLSAGQVHNCLARDGLVYCWGDNGSGQLGVGDIEPRLVPTLIPSVSGIIQVSVGAEHSCLLDNTGSVACFGSNKDGQLGSPDVTRSTAPLSVSLPASAIAIDANYRHTCAVLQTNELYCWGENAETQLGQGDVPDVNQFEPIAVPLAGKVAAVACGQGHTAAIDLSGNLLAWGRNSTGEAGVGAGTAPRIRVPTLLATGVAFDELDGGQNSTCALGVDGTLFCWGVSIDRHLGTGIDGTQWSPTAVVADATWRSASSDTFHTCAIDDHDRLFCWGRAIEGQLGIGMHDDPVPDPTLLEGTWQAVGVGRFHTCALTVEGRLWCTGHNGEGELGLGDTEKRFVFTEVSLPPANNVAP